MSWWKWLVGGLVGGLLVYEVTKPTTSSTSATITWVAQPRSGGIINVAGATPTDAQVLSTVNVGDTIEFTMAAASTSTSISMNDTMPMVAVSAVVRSKDASSFTVQLFMVTDMNDAAKALPAAALPAPTHATNGASGPTYTIGPSAVAGIG